MIARAGRLGEGGDERAADDQALLVREREVDALGEGDDRRAEARRARDRVQDEVGARGRDQLAHPLLAGEDAVALGGAALGGAGVGDRDAR